MRILQVHNFYQQAGGEDRVVEAERTLLTNNGHSVYQYTVHNDSVGGLSSIELGVKTVWNFTSYRTISNLITELGIEIVHVHNTLPLISPAVYYAAAKQGVPVVQTLHNYRLLCPKSTLYREGRPCELCVGETFKRSAIKYRCYRDSWGASAAIAVMLGGHNLLGTFQRKIHTYIALTQFAKEKFREGGLPADRIVVKPNFAADDPGVGGGEGGYALFAGRLIPEKGVMAMLDAWASTPSAIPLKIAGAGPLETLVRERVAKLPHVEFLGVCEPSQVTKLLKEAAFLVLPSLWYEGLPMVLVESMACGTPVVAFALGSMNDLIVDGVNGVKLPLNEGKDILGHFLKDSRELTEMMKVFREGTRAYFERHFSARKNYELLLSVYTGALNRSVL
jgi:glycosyltransferase involved in cell wall biosynthesis